MAAAARAAERADARQAMRDNPARDIHWTPSRRALIPATSITGRAIASIARGAAMEEEPAAVLEARGRGRDAVSGLVWRRTASDMGLTVLLLAGIPALILAVGLSSGTLTADGSLAWLAGIYALAVAGALLVLGLRHQREVAALDRWAPPRDLDLKLDAQSVSVHAADRLQLQGGWRIIALAGAETRHWRGRTYLSAISIAHGPKTVVPLHRELWEPGDALLARVVRELLRHHRIELV
jgi:hypothetical protein